MDMDIGYEIRRLERQVKRLERNIKMCQEEITGLKGDLRRPMQPQERQGHRETRDIPRENRQPPM